MEWGCFLSGSGGIIRVHFLPDAYDCANFWKENKNTIVWLCLYVWVSLDDD